MTTEHTVLELVRRFIQDNEIRSAETIYQADRVGENALEFIELLCEVVGYYKDEDEDND